jgi:phospholipid/cholesterol/gamma-HCH transport system ATP-binding protein
MIEVKNISKRFGDKVVLEDISATFEKGKTNLVIGGSGSGKTVLMKCMVGLLEVDSGEVFFDERNFSALDFKQRKPFRQEIGMVFQGGALFDSLNVERNIMFPLSMFTDMTEAEKRDRANDCLERVNLVNANKLFPSQLSGGMKKRVAIARAISPNPKYLFLDEPNSGLDPQTSILIDNLVKEITEEYQTTTVINTHDMNSVLEIGDKILFLHEGKKWWEGSNMEITSSKNDVLKNFIFASKILRELLEKN